MKKNNGAKIVLYIFFVGLLIAAVVIGIYAATHGNQVVIIPPETEYSPEELFVDDSEKYNIKIDVDTVKMSPDVDLAQERINHKTRVPGRKPDTRVSV